jgi:hypothetical protein
MKSHRRRRGRQDVIEDIEVEANELDTGADLNVEVTEEALEDVMTADANGDGVPDWCNPITPMGAWLNFRKMKIWCVDNGYGPSFGPYGSGTAANGGSEEDGADGEMDMLDEADGKDDMMTEEEIAEMEDDDDCTDDDDDDEVDDSMMPMMEYEDYDYQGMEEDEDAA